VVSAFCDSAQKFRIQNLNKLCSIKNDILIFRKIGVICFPPEVVRKLEFIEALVVEKIYCQYFCGQNQNQNSET
jgi:hypothetical protein